MATGSSLSRYAFRVLIVFIVLYPLTQYLGTFHVDPHLPAWQESVYTNTLIGTGTYIGLSGLWDLYQDWKREIVKAYILSWGLGF